VRLIGLEAGGDGVETGRHAATITGGSPGVLHGTRSYVLQDANGQTIESHSISAGLGLPRCRAQNTLIFMTSVELRYRAINDDAAMEAFSITEQNRRDYSCD